MVQRLLLTVLLISTLGTVNLCELSLKSWEMPWTVTVRKKFNHKILCVGLITSDDNVAVSLSCLLEPAGQPYKDPRNIEVIAGFDCLTMHWPAGTNGSCIQKKIGLGYIIHKYAGFLITVALLQIEPFDFSPTDRPIVPFPSSIDDVVKYWSFKKPGVFCKLPIFTSETKNLSNQVSVRTVILTRMPDCEKYHMGLRWSYTTYHCFRFAKNSTVCNNFNVGTPLLCDGKVMGILKDCHSGPEMLVQRLTDELLTLVKGKWVIPKLIATFKVRIKNRLMGRIK